MSTGRTGNQLVAKIPDSSNRQRASRKDDFMPGKNIVHSLVRLLEVLHSENSKRPKVGRFFSGKSIERNLVLF